MSDAILADLLSRDPRRVYEGTWALVRLHDEARLDALAASIGEIEGATADLDLGGMFYSNNQSLAFALRRLRFHRDRAGCLCELYPTFLLYDPEWEADAGHVRILGDTRETWLCECTYCGARYDVQYGEAHASWWDWSPAVAHPPPG